MDVLGGRPRIDRDASRRIQSWVGELRRLPAAASVSVQELRCAEPDCPDVETVVLISLGPGCTLQHKIRKPAVEVTRGDLDAVLEP